MVPILASTKAGSLAADSLNSTRACVRSCSRSLGSAESLKPLMCLSLSGVPMGKVRREITVAPGS
jgi:hypothetical protein